MKNDFMVKSPSPSILQAADPVCSILFGMCCSQVDIIYKTVDMFAIMFNEFDVRYPTKSHYLYFSRSLHTTIAWCLYHIHYF